MICCCERWAALVLCGCSTLTSLPRVPLSVPEWIVNAWHDYIQNGRLNLSWLVTTASLSNRHSSHSVLIRGYFDSKRSIIINHKLSCSRRNWSDGVTRSKLLHDHCIVSSSSDRFQYTTSYFSSRKLLRWPSTSLTEFPFPLEISSCS